MGGLIIVAGTPRGGGQDRAARAIASVLEPKAVVTNIPGRGGGNAWDHVESRPGDTGIVAVSSPTLITNRILGQSRIDDRDLSPIATLYTEYSAVVGRVASEGLSPGDFFERLAGGALTVSFATALGSVNHLALAEIGRQLGADAGTIPMRVFDSAQMAIADVLDGNADVGFVSSASATAKIGQGALQAVAMVAPHRLGGVLSGVPTFVELGVDCQIGLWRGLIGPPRLDAETMDAWADRLAVATSTRRWGDLLARHGWVDTFLEPAGTSAFLDEQRRALRAMLESAGLKPAVESG